MGPPYILSHYKPVISLTITHNFCLDIAQLSRPILWLWKYDRLLRERTNERTNRLTERQGYRDC